MDDILKEPIFVGEDYPYIDSTKGDFVWLQKFPINDFNLKFISNEEDARATVFIDIRNGELAWVIDTFVVDAEKREQGQGEEALLQLLYEIRENEYKFLKIICNSFKLIDVPFKAALAASEGSERKIIRVLEEKITGPNSQDKLDIFVGDIEPEARGFWEKMFRRYGESHKGTYLGLKKSTAITDTKGKLKTSSKPIPEEINPNCIEIYKEIHKLVLELRDMFRSPSGFPDDTKFQSNTDYRINTARGGHRNNFSDHSQLKIFNMGVEPPDFKRIITIMCDASWSAPANSEEDICKILYLIVYTPLKFTNENANYEYVNELRRIRFNTNEGFYQAVINADKGQGDGYDDWAGSFTEHLDLDIYVALSKAYNNYPLDDQTRTAITVGLDTFYNVAFLKIRRIKGLALKWSLGIDDLERYNPVIKQDG